MKYRLLLLGIWISFLFCYLEWGQDNSGFMFQMEWTAFMEARKSLSAIVHPFILLPFLGQILVLIAIFQKRSRRRLVVAGVLLLSLLVLMILLVGILAFNLKIILSTVPFLLIAVYVLFFCTRVVQEA
jgi:heme A synthase